MKSTLITIFIISCLLLIIWGSYGYVKGKINLRRQSYVTETPPKGVFTIKEAEERIKDSVLKSTVMVIAGALGIFLVIYQFNKPVKKYKVHTYKS
jgi:TRAP-type C4-dicarboxylate transport system permease small subunit